MKIGNVTMRFDQKGKLDSITLIADAGDIRKGDSIFDQIESCKDEKEMLERAKQAFSYMFTLVNSVELFDRETLYLSNVPYKLDRYPDGLIKEIGISYEVLPLEK